MYLFIGFLLSKQIKRKFKYSNQTKAGDTQQTNDGCPGSSCMSQRSLHNKTIIILNYTKTFMVVRAHLLRCVTLKRLNGRNSYYFNKISKRFCKCLMVC